MPFSNFRPQLNCEKFHPQEALRCFGLPALASVQTATSPNLYRDPSIRLQTVNSSFAFLQVARLLRCSAAEERGLTNLACVTNIPLKARVGMLTSCWCPFRREALCLSSKSCEQSKQRVANEITYRGSNRC